MKPFTDYYLYFDSRIAQLQSAGPTTNKSAVQPTTMAPCCEDELFTYTKLLQLRLAQQQLPTKKQFAMLGINILLYHFCLNSIHFPVM